MEWWTGTLEWNDGMEWWTGMMQWWAGTSNKLGNSIALIGILVAFTHGKHILAFKTFCLSRGLNYLQLANT